MQQTMKWSKCVNLLSLVAATEGYCAAEVVALCHRAVTCAILANENAEVCCYNF